MTHQVFFHGYFTPESWETVNLLSKASGGIWQEDDTHFPGIPHFLFEKGVPQGITTMMTLGDFPYIIRNKSTALFPKSRWSLFNQNKKVDEQLIRVNRLPQFTHPHWELIFRKQCGVFQSAHQALSLKKDGIAVEI